MAVEWSSHNVLIIDNQTEQVCYPTLGMEQVICMNQTTVGH